MSTVGAHSQRFAYGPGIALSLSAKPSIMGHFRAEYKSAAVPSEGDPADVDVEFVRHVEPADGLSVRGGYKTARWRVVLSTPGEHPLRAQIAIAGAPLSFGLSLVQGYFVEPLIAALDDARVPGDLLRPVAQEVLFGEALPDVLPALAR